MKKTIRILCMLLILTLSVSLFACTTETPATSEPDASVPDESSAEESFELFSNLPSDKNYDGAPFVVLVVGDYADIYKSVEVMPQADSYELVQKSVKDRNELVEEKFGVEISEIRTTGYGEIVTAIRNDSLSGTSEYDLVMPYMFDAATLAAEGAFYDLRKLENIHLDRPYYVQGSVSGLSIRNQNYFVSGDMCLLDFACTHALEFNKDMITEHELESPYDLVENGEWTLDKMKEMAHGLNADTDGTDGMGCNDTYGFLTTSGTASSLFVSAGFNITGKNAEDEPYIAINGEAAAAAYQKIFDFEKDDATSILIDDTTKGYYQTAMTSGKPIWTVATESVANKKALFRSIAIIDIFELGEYDCNFGVLPMPKYDNNQDGYRSRVSTIMSSCVAIPKNVADVEKSSIILDAMMQASTETTKKAYFETIMKERKIQDTESERMLDCIFNGRVYDLSYLYSWGDGTNTLCDFMNTLSLNSTNTFTSTFESIKSACETGIQETVDAYRSLEK